MVEARLPPDVAAARARDKALRALGKRHKLELVVLVNYFRGAAGLPPLSARDLAKYGVTTRLWGCGVKGHPRHCLCDLPMSKVRSNGG